MAMVPLHSRHTPISCNITATMPLHPSAYITYASTNDICLAYASTDDICLTYASTDDICLAYASTYDICIRKQHMPHISWCLIDTVPLHLSTHFSYKLLQCLFISQHKRSLGQSIIVRPAISTTQYRSKVYYNHFHSNNVKYHNDSTSDIQ